MINVKKSFLNYITLLLQGHLWPGVVEPDSFLSIGQIELFDFLILCKEMIYAKQNWLKLNCLII